MESTSIIVDLTVASIAEGRILKHDTVRIETIRNRHSSERNVVIVIVVVIIIIIIIIVTSTFQCWLSRGGGFLDVFRFGKEMENVHDCRDASMHACMRVSGICTHLQNGSKGMPTIPGVKYVCTYIVWNGD